MLQFGVHPAPSPVAGVPGFVTYEVLVVAASEISGLCETVVSEVSPSNPPHTPAPSVHRIHRQLAPPGRWQAPEHHPTKTRGRDTNGGRQSGLPRDTG